jgi:hypothetical protein
MIMMAWIIWVVGMAGASRQLDRINPMYLTVHPV